eukprot:2061429-Prymnesium_polylepis.1
MRTRVSSLRPRLACFGCGLCHDDRLVEQEALALHTIAALKAIIRKQCLPLPWAEQRAALANSLLITHLAEQPPAVCHAKRDLHECRCAHGVVDEQHAACFE